MKKIIFEIALTCMVLAFSFNAIADNLISQADAICNIFNLSNLKKSIEMYKTVLKSDPNNYEVCWKYAKACRDYGIQSKCMMMDGWKDVCVIYGKEGMTYAENAIALSPEKVEGHYYYGLCVGVYADGVGILTAVKENLKKKTQRGLEKAYALDKMYNEGGPILALGRFWSVIPWPLKNKDKALKYLREYQNTPYFSVVLKGRIYLAELLMDIGGDENEIEAKKWASQIALSDVEYYRTMAEKLLVEF